VEGQAVVWLGADSVAPFVRYSDLVVSSAAEARYWRHYGYHWYGRSWSGSRPNGDDYAMHWSKSRLRHLMKKIPCSRMSKNISGSSRTSKGATALRLQLCADLPFKDLRGA
jgi:hypothetical protein